MAMTAEEKAKAKADDAAAKAAAAVTGAPPAPKVDKTGNIALTNITHKGLVIEAGTDTTGKLDEAAVASLRARGHLGSKADYDQKQKLAKMVKENKIYLPPVHGSEG